jgi:hypothetical protein
VVRDTSDAPSTISEQSRVVLSKGGVEDIGESSMIVTECVAGESHAMGHRLDHPLASGFDLHSGSVSVTIPADTVAGSDYAIVCEYLQPSYCCWSHLIL